VVLIGGYLLPPSALGFYVFAAGLGFTWLATVPPTASLVGKLFGLRYLGTLFGLTLLSHQIGGFPRRLAGRAGGGRVRQLQLDVVRRHGAGRHGSPRQSADPRSPGGARSGGGLNLRGASSRSAAKPSSNTPPQAFL
jgi:hypothetical protein